MPNERVTSRALRRALREFDWLSFLERAGLDVNERNGEVSGECPWCHHHRTSFYVKQGVGVFKCHYCNESGWAIKLIRHVARCTTDEAIARIMAHRVSIYSDTEWQPDEPGAASVEDDADEEELPPVIELPEGFHLLADSHGETARRYREYALGRMTEAQMDEYRVGFCATGRYRKRIIVPVYYLGSLVNWVARYISDDPPAGVHKVTTPPGNEQYSYLFNLEKVWGREQVVITEGVFDCLALDDMAVATFGKKVTDAQVIALANAGVGTVVLAWDSDAQREIFDAYSRLRFTFQRVTVVEIPPGEDPASIGHAGMVQLVKAASVPRWLTRDGARDVQKSVEVRI